MFDESFEGHVTTSGTVVVRSSDFKTIYFPKHRVRRGSSARVTVSLATERNTELADAAELVRKSSSAEVRRLLGDPFLEDLEALAHREGRSFSNACLWQLSQSLTRPTANEIRAADPQRNDLGVTFQESKHQAIHSWYPYVEGFSATYVRDTIFRLSGDELPKRVFDPFGGAGTVQVACSWLGIESGYCEINPFMRLVAEAKVNAASEVAGSLGDFRELVEEFCKRLGGAGFAKKAARVDLSDYEQAFPSRDFFAEHDLRMLLAARGEAEALTEDWPAARQLLLLACSANVVKSSHMTRRADLRRRRSDEYKNRVVDVSAFVQESARQIHRDIALIPSGSAATRLVSNDCRQLPDSHVGVFDFAITSPPYLNGTNYFRNTKLELWFAGLIDGERDLPKLTDQAIVAGINNVRAGKNLAHAFEEVEAVAGRLVVASPDKRIPDLVRHYFSDMFDVLVAVRTALKPDSFFVLDIGDSKFYGVHVPTDRLLVQVAAAAGLELVSEKLLARRHSRDKSPLVQMELTFRTAAAW